MEPGQVFCYKTTGELCLILAIDGDRVKVRRPVMTHENGIQQSEDFIYAFELETVEQHLRREGQEMVLKSRIQNEMMEELKKMDEKKPLAELVN